MKRSQALPICEHGNSVAYGCPKCQIDREKISIAIQPLVESFWNGRGKDDLEHLMYQAYRMGRNSGLVKE